MRHEARLKKLEDACGRGFVVVMPTCRYANEPGGDGRRVVSVSADVGDQIITAERQEDEAMSDFEARFGRLVRDRVEQGKSVLVLSFATDGL